MHDLLEQILTALRHAWRRRWLCLAVAWPLAVLGWLAVVLLPARYESTARVYADAESLLSPLVKDAQSTFDLAAQLQIMQRNLLSRPNLLRLVQGTLLATRADDAADVERMVSALPDRILIQHEGANVYAISYRDRDPVVAAAVARELLELLRQSGFGASMESVEAARQFLDEQIALQERSLREAEARLAAFQKRHVDFVPGRKSQAERLQDAHDQARAARSDLEAARAQWDVLDRQLAAVPATVPAQALAGGAQSALLPDSPAGQLVVLRRRLAELTNRYTDQHPDVQATRRAIADIEAHAGNSGYPGSAGSISIANPLHEQLRLQLAQREGEIASLENRLKQAERLVDELGRTAQVAPDTEAKFKQLARDYDVIRRQYEQLVARRESVRIASDLNQQTGRVDFRVIDPPQVPLSPASPPRIPLMGAVLLASLLSGAGLAVALGMLAQPFETPRALRQAFNLPVLGSITEVVTAQARRRKLMDTSRFALACLALFGLFVSMVAAETAQLTGPLRTDFLEWLMDGPAT